MGIKDAARETGLPKEGWEESRRQEVGLGANSVLSNPLPGEPDCLLGHLGCGRGSDWSDSHRSGAARSHPCQLRAGPTQSAAAAGHL